MSEIKDIHNGKFHFFYKSKLSNFNIAPFTVYGKVFQCGEQALHWKKAMFFNDLEIAQKIYESGLDPRSCLRLGREVKNYNDELWSKAREEIMYEISLARFSQVENVKLQLLDTGDKYLVEASETDRKYGIGYSVTDAPATPVELWGDNMLGRVLTRVKNELRKK